MTPTSALSDFVDLWSDPSRHPDADDWAPGHPTPGEQVLNVRFVANAGRHETALREIWGGPLCVTTGGVALSELEALRTRLWSELDHVGNINLDPVGGHASVNLAVAHVDQAELDRRYGVGRVRLLPAFEPLTAGRSDR